jgi:ferrous iron transport protein B
MASFGEALGTIPENLGSVFGSLSDPLGLEIVGETDKGAIAEEIGAENSIFTTLRTFFSTASAFSYLLFILLYFPCIAAYGAIVGEVGNRMGIIIATYLTVLAWVVSTLYYQIVEGHQFIWIVVPILLLIATIGFFFLLSNKSQIEK